MSFWEANWEALGRKYPAIVSEKPENWQPSPKWETIELPQDVPTARWKGQYLHSSRAPLREAQKVASAKRGTLYQGRIFFGAGLGYLMEILIEDNLPFLWIAPDKDLFFHLLYYRDFCKIINKPGFNLLLEAPPGALHFFLEDIIGNQLDLVPNKAYQNLYPQYWQGVSQEFYGFLDRKKINRNTLNRFGKLWTHNMARNLPALGTYPGIQNLVGILKGSPVVLLAAGPSLTQGLEHFTALKERAFLIAVDTACTALTAQGLKPDMVISVDPQYWNARHLDRFDSKEVILITDSTIHGSVLKNWKGPVYLTASHFPLCEYLESRIDPKGKIAAGGSVTTAAWDLARILGPEAIYIMGMDLGYPKGETHVKGSYFEERMIIRSSRFLTAESQVFRYLSSGNPVWERDFQGNPLLSDQRLTIYRTWFERVLPQHKGLQNFTLSPQGLSIETLEPCTLQDFLKSQEATTRKVIHQRLKELPYNQPATTQKIQEEIGMVQREIQNLLETVQEGLSCFSPLSVQGVNFDKLERVERKILTNQSRHAASYLVLPLMEDMINKQSASLEENLEGTKEFYNSLEKTLQFTLDQLKMGSDIFFSKKT